MGRFKIGDRVRVNVTIGSIYDKAGIIVGLASMQTFDEGQCYLTPNWKVRLDNDHCIALSERYLNPDRAQGE